MKRSLLILLTLTGCTPPPSTGSDLVGHPGVSAPVIEATRQKLLAATPFDCKAYAQSLLPWTGPLPSRIFDATNEALLPDAPEFTVRRGNACAILKLHSGGQ